MHLGSRTGGGLRCIYPGCLLLLSLMGALSSAHDSTDLKETLFMTNGTSLLKISVPTNDIDTILLEDVQKISYVAAVEASGLLFMAGTFGGKNGIFRASSDGRNISIIVHDIGHVSGLAVHRDVQLVYWTDDDRNTIEVVNYWGYNRMLLVDSDVWWPQGIVLDPDVGWLFWYDQGNSCLRRAQMDGSDRQTLICNSLLWLNQLSLNADTRSIYWVDEHNATISSSDYNGHNVRVEMDFSHHLDLKGPLRGLAPTNTGLYFSTDYQCGIYNLSAARPGKGRTYTKLATVKGNMDSCLVFYSRQTRSVSTPALDCSHLTLTTGAGRARCACPSYGGLVLQPDNRTCAAPARAILFTDEQNGFVGFINPDRIALDDYHLIAKSPKPVAIGYDPDKGHVYWSDVDEMMIRRADMAGSYSEVFIGKEEGVGIVDGLVVDSVNGRLYFSNRGFSAPKADGNVYSWNRIEVISLDKTYRKTLVIDVDKPRALALDLERKHLYYTEWGKRPRVVRTNLDGSEQAVIRYSDISNPNALALRGNKLYMVDSNYNKLAKEVYVGIYDLDDESWADFHIEAKTPFGLTALPGMIVGADWGGTGYQKGGVWRTPTDGHLGDKLEPVLPAWNWGRPTGLLAIDLRPAGPGVHQPCTIACGGFCVDLPDGTEKCVCSDGSSKLHAHGTSCQVPRQFLLFCDLNTVNLLSLEEDSDTQLEVIHYGSSDANYVAVAFDSAMSRVFFSDLTTGEVYSKHVGPGESPTEVLYKGCQVVDFMAFDSTKNTLFWTCYDPKDSQGAIKMAVFVEDAIGDVKTLTVTHGRPRALAVNSRYIYWSEYGGRHGESYVKRELIIGGDPQVLLQKGLRWPNSLIVHGDWLFVADGGLQKILTYNTINGSHSVLHHLPDHIFGMTLVGTSLYYTSWFSQNLGRLELKTGLLSAVLHNLVRPTHIAHGWREGEDKDDSFPTHIPGSVFHEPDLLATYAPPLIHNCPENARVALVLPPGQNYTRLNISLSAVDGVGQPLPIRGTHQVPPGTTFFWKGYGAAGHQFVHYSATDEHEQTTSCDFVVRVVDREPPRFVTCSGYQSHLTPLGGAHMYWDDPEVVDNVGVVRLTSEGPLSGSLLGVGVHNVTYVALDGDANAAHCDMIIEVIHQDIGCPLPPLLREPSHGSLRCVASPLGHDCRTECDARTHVLNTRDGFHNVTCLPNGTWFAGLPTSYQFDACRRVSIYRTAEKEIQLKFDGYCYKKETKILESMSRSIEMEGLCSYGFSLCYKSSLRLSCPDQPEKVGGDGRIKRSNPSFSVNIILSKFVRFSEVGDVKNDMENITLIIEELFQNLTLYLHNQTIGTNTGILVEPTTTKCTDGNYQMGDFCVACPANTYYSSSNSSCEPCQLGTYQPEEGQSKCLSCAEYDFQIGNVITQYACSWTSPLVGEQPLLLRPNADLTWVVLGALLSTLILCLVLAVLYHRWRRGRHIKISNEDTDIQEDGCDKDTTALQTISTPEPKRPRRTFPYLQNTPYTRV